ncbi:hypothetical protein ACVIHH_008279 [Bradyrhizobium sp. USDA 4518]
MFFLTVNCVVAALPVNDERQFIAHDIDDDLFDKQPDDPLACLDGRPGAVPRPGQILAESHQPRAIRGGKRWRMLRLFEGLELDLQVAQFQRRSNSLATNRLSGSTAAYCRRARAASD